MSGPKLGRRRPTSSLTCRCYQLTAGGCITSEPLLHVWHKSSITTVGIAGPIWLAGLVATCDLCRRWPTREVIAGKDTELRGVPSPTVVQNSINASRLSEDESKMAGSSWKPSHVAWKQRSGEVLPAQRREASATHAKTRVICGTAQFQATRSLPASMSPGPRSSPADRRRSRTTRWRHMGLRASYSDIT